MRNNPAGHMLIICKKYTENSRSIRWNTTGDLSIHSGKSIIIHGKQHGIKFRKNISFHITEKE